MKVAGLEKEGDEEVSSGSREKATQDVAGDKEVGIGTPKKRPRATELQKLQIGTQSPQMPRKLRTKQHVDDGGKPKPKKGPSYTNDRHLCKGGPLAYAHSKVFCWNF